MKYIWSSEIDSILNTGRSLENIGICNWALEREAALAAIEQLSAIKVAVLGGDVYSVSDTGIQSNYDSWYCNRDSRENNVDFVLRSIAKARDYISTYQASVGSVVFTIVPYT